MVSTNKKDLKSMSKEDLKVKLIELRKDLIKENAQIAIGTTPKSPGRIRQVKKGIARMIQIINDKEVKRSNE